MGLGILDGLASALGMVRTREMDHEGVRETDDL